MLASTLRRFSQQAIRFQHQQLQPRRGFAADHHHAPSKVDTSLDHVFGDSSNKLSYNFEAMPMGSLFVRSLVITGVFLFPVWIFLYDDYKYMSFQEKLAAAKAKSS